MSDKVALVTGAADPVGQAIAKRLLADGYKVVLNDPDDAALGLATEQVPGSVSIFGNVATDAGADQVFSSLEKQFGRLDVLINNQNGFGANTFDGCSPEDLRAVFSATVIPAMNCAKRAAKLMEDKKITGHIMNASTDHAFVTDPDYFADSAVSWALRGTTRAMAKQVAKSDIKVNAYCVGDVSPDEVAAVVAFYVEDQNVNITGQNVMVNHGRYMD